MKKYPFIQLQLISGQITYRVYQNNIKQNEKHESWFMVKLFRLI